MPVSITWATTPSGSGVSLIDHGSASNGAYSSPNQQIYVRHDGANPITGAAFYFAQKATGYAGDFSAGLDYTEIITEWGGNNTASGHGGIQVNMDPSNTTVYNASTWDLSESSKSTSVAFTASPGVGDSSANAVTLKEHMDGTAAGGSMSTDGTIPNGVEVSFLARWLIPTDEATAGIRQIDQVLKYTFTS